MTPSVLSKDNRALPAWTHFTVEAAHTCLAENAVELGLLGILATDVADTSLLII